MDIVELALKQYGKPVFVKHQIVHNPHVVSDLEQRGAITVERVEEIPEGSVVVFSAHGSAPSDFEIARKNNLLVIDATCPLVTKVHNEAKKYHREGRHVILVGHRGHQEVIGTMGQAPMLVMDERENPEIPPWDDEAGVTVLTQTTLSVNDTAKAIDDIRSVHPDAIVRNDICYATTNRQLAVMEIAKLTQLVLVIGAQNSSNCQRLREVAEAEGTRSFLITGPEELEWGWFEGVERVGITSGASTPEKAVSCVINSLSPSRVINVGHVEENITFTLPSSLRS